MRQAATAHSELTEFFMLHRGRCFQGWTADKLIAGVTCNFLGRSMYSLYGRHLGEQPREKAKQNPQQGKQPLASNRQFEQRPTSPTAQCKNTQRKQTRWDNKRIPAMSDDKLRGAGKPHQKLRPIGKLQVRPCGDNALAKKRVDRNKKAGAKSAKSCSHKTNVSGWTLQPAVMRFFVVCHNSKSSKSPQHQQPKLMGQECCSRPFRDDATARTRHLMRLSWISTDSSSMPPSLGFFPSSDSGADQGG
jgi:hypothetical protein